MTSRNDVLTELRSGAAAVRYLVGTPKGRLTRYEAALDGRELLLVRRTGQMAVVKLLRAE